MADLKAIASQIRRDIVRMVHGASVSIRAVHSVVLIFLQPSILKS
jgi:hypothetical protein